MSADEPVDQTRGARAAEYLWQREVEMGVLCSSWKALGIFVGEVTTL